MASLIPGYEYDIFISYRQKDNKHDGWVTEFVNNLKGELESTFKEEISVYFDINPHDGLLETHDVNASLKDKLRCLIFIPIISRTYCDPRSFAWEHEFKAFVGQASQDKFGLKVKLSGGNVASRVLPVHIHDLNSVDRKLVEDELGYLRGIEFIYKEPGVNRPLMVNEDYPDNNLNKTFYRNQINKVANAIDEIFSGLKKGTTLTVNEKTPTEKKPPVEGRKVEKSEFQDKSVKLPRRKLLIGGIALAVLLIIAVIFAFPKIFKKNTLEKLRSSSERISVAVMPFQNMSNDTIWNIWQDGIQNLLITSLSNSEDLKVKGPELINSLLQSKGLTNYASITPSVASTISQKLDANVLIYGSVNKAGMTLRLNAQLINSRTTEVFKSFQIEGSSKEENIFHLIDTLSTKVKNYFIISKLIKEETPDRQKAMATITSPQAFKILIDGGKAFAKDDYPTAINMFLQVLAIDSSIVDPFLYITWAYLNQGLYEEAKKWYLRAYEKENLMSKEQKLDEDVLHAWLFETSYDVIRRLRQKQDFDDENPVVYNDLGAMYYKLHQYDKAIPEYKKSLDIYNKWGIKPFWIFNYAGLGWAYYKTGQLNKAKRIYKKEEQDFPSIYQYFNWQQAALALAIGDTIVANLYIEQRRSLAKENSWSDARFIGDLGRIYSEAGILDKAEKYYRQSLALEPDSALRLNDLANFLIDKNRNINEGLELIDKALNLDPDNYNYLNTKGWGLYKHGKYKEALEILQKSWDLRREKAVYDHEAYLHLEEVKKAIANQKKD
jgi:tetratricopeptide (TPR) repeat protein